MVQFLTELQGEPDRARLSLAAGEAWSVRKVLRRLVRHELLHWKSIQRILSAYGSVEAGL